MKLFLIRHGKTQHNVENRHQDEHATLLDESLEEVAILAPKLATFNIDVIFSSPFVRTLKTTEIINEILNVPLKIENDLKEIKRPTVIENRLKSDQDVIEVKSQLFENRKDRDWHHSDEENFYDLTGRVERFIKLIEAESYENVLVVTHNAIIKTIVLLILFSQNLDVDVFYDFYNKTSVSNGAMATCEFKDGKWKLINFNVKL